MPLSIKGRAPYKIMLTCEGETLTLDCDHVTRRAMWLWVRVDRGEECVQGDERVMLYHLKPNLFTVAGREVKVELKNIAHGTWQVAITAPQDVLITREEVTP